MRIQDKLGRYSWSIEAVNQLQLELRPFLEAGFVIPVEPGGWWHQYVCPSHHTELLFDPMEEDANVFRCPYGCELMGEPYRGAWLVYKHQSLARYMLQAAAIYAATHDEQYARLSRNLLIRYAVQFPLYPVHPDAQPWMLKGRAFHQALTEAIWATTLLRGYLLLRDEGVDLSADHAALEPFLDLLEGSMSEYHHILVHEKKNPENNYTAWLNAALSCVHVVRGDKAKLEQLISGEGGLLHHITIGVKPDQFEFEGSVYYHIFVLRAYLITAEMAERFGIDLYHLEGEQGQSFKGMLDVLVKLADPNGQLPALHDGPFKRLPYAREISEIFEIGLSQYQDASYTPILAEAYRQLNQGRPLRNGLEALVFGTGEYKLDANNDNNDDDKSDGVNESKYNNRNSVLLPDSGFAVLRHPNNALCLIVDFGPHGGSHGHYDKCNIILNHKLGAIAPELGMVPYGSDLRKGWYAETASHNTVSVGGQSQQPHVGECKKYENTPAYSYIWTSTDQAYEGCVMNRHLLLTEDWLLDWFEVSIAEGGEDRHIDWWLHTAQELKVQKTNDWYDDSTPLGTEGGYNHIRPISRADGISRGQCDLLLQVETHDSVEDNNAQVTMSTLLSPLSSIYRVRTPGMAMDPSRLIDGFMHRQTSHSARFITVFRDGSEFVNLSSLVAQQEGEGIRIGIGQQQWTIIKTTVGLQII